MARCRHSKLEWVGTIIISITHPRELFKCSTCGNKVVFMFGATKYSLSTIMNVWDDVEVSEFP